METEFLEPRQQKRSRKLLVVLVILLIALGAGTMAYYYETSIQISKLNNSISSLESQVGSSQMNGSANSLATSELANSTNFNIDPVAIYDYANASVVTVQGLQTSSSTFGSSTTTTVLGSGFVVQYDNSFYIVTNFHVVDGDSNLSVTFSNGDAYAAKVVGSDPYSDLAVVSTSAPSSEFHPLSIASSLELEVGEAVVAIGNPFGLSGSMTFGIVSQLGRTITESSAGNYPISDLIQISTPINPGNSGGPLFNENGQVVGITTAIISNSQGVGFAIPSDTILRELPSLITSGSYNLHPYLGITMADMNYDISTYLGLNVTYGVLVQSVSAGTPAANAGLKGGSSTAIIDGQQYYVGGDVITSINGTRVTSGDALSSWLEEHAVPNQAVELGVIRDGSRLIVPVTLGTRPPPG